MMSRFGKLNLEHPKVPNERKNFLMYNIEWKEHALKEMEKFDESIVRRMIEKIEEMREDFSLCDVKKMKNLDDHYRLRVGDYRLIFELKDSLVTILKVGHRQNIYDE